jgi:glutamyl-tRNA reductase
MSRLLLVGLNHTTAPLEVRERLAFGPQRLGQALAAFKQRFAEAELVVLSTCNRVELYSARPVHGHPRLEEMVQFLAEFHGIPAESFASHLYQKAELDVVRHLFTVVSSMDSMVLGETQILGQVRGAYDAAAAAGAAGTVLHPLFQRAIAVGKQVMNRTALCEGRVSVASVAVDYAQQIFDHFADKTVLSIGAGKMAVLALTGFRQLNPGRLLVCNRDAAKAQILAQRFGGKAVPFDTLSEHLVSADVVISSTGSPQPIISVRQFQPLLPLRRYRPVFLIDIALPRDVEAAVGELENVYLYNLDDLQKVVADTQAQRSGAVEGARQIVEQQVREFVDWTRARELGPLIDKLYRRSTQMAMEEVTRTLNKLPNIDPHERQHLEELAKRIVNKLLHQPVHTLRQSEGVQSPASHYAATLEKLFGLDEESPPS